MIHVGGGVRRDTWEVGRGGTCGRWCEEGHVGGGMRRDMREVG